MNNIKSHFKYRSNKLRNEVSLYYKYVNKLLEFAQLKLNYFKEHKIVNIDEFEHDSYLINLDFAATILMEKMRNIGFNTDKWYNYFFQELSIKNVYQKI